ncbi:hypothetical protein [Algoriphagus sp. PAP.12]|uniref:hypothetical protein n=1 Tax=Algoriphagus sp. PAP.12 TaxID=2996678 RepID=UPI00227B4C04|nr:hypothetical protein [Algoriphagus sp. PAP.12]
MKCKFLIALIISFFPTFSSAQVLKVVDAKTLIPIPFFHLYDSLKSKVLIGGEEGEVPIQEILKVYQGSVHISHVGYEKSVLNLNDFVNVNIDVVWELTPIEIQLEEVKAQVFDEDQLYRDFQKKLKDHLSLNSWLVRVHTLELISEEGQLIEQYGLFGFGGLVNRKGKFAKFDKSNYFLISEYARKNGDISPEGWFTTKDLLGVLLNEVFLYLEEVKPKDVEVLNSFRDGAIFLVKFQLGDLGLELVISEDVELHEINWNKPLELNLGDNINVKPGKIRFYPNSDLLVPISINFDFEIVKSNQKRQFFMLSSFIPNSLNYQLFLSKNYELADYYRLMTVLANYDDYNSEDVFFESSIAKFENRKMSKFSDFDMIEKVNWIDNDALEVIFDRNPEADKKKVDEFYIYKKSLIEEFRKLGLTW